VYSSTIIVTNIYQSFFYFLPARWRQKSTATDMKQNYVTVTLCVHVTQPEISSKTASECLPISYAHRQPGHFVCEQPENMPPTASTGCVSARVSKHKGNNQTNHPLVSALLDPQTNSWGKRHCTRFKQDLRCQHLTESYYCKTGICHLYSARLTWKKINSSSNIYSISDVQTSTYLKTKLNKLKCGVAHVNFPWRNKHVG